MPSYMLFILAAVGALFAFWLVMKPILDDNRVRGKVLNFSEGMKEYYFLLEQGKEETEAALTGQQMQTALEYSFSPEEESIRFRKDSEEADYRLRFCEDGGKNYLSVSRVAEEREKGNIPYLVNAFFIKGLNAAPVDCRAFRSLFPADET